MTPFCVNTDGAILTAKFLEHLVPGGNFFVRHRCWSGCRAMLSLCAVRIRGPDEGGAPDVNKTLEQLASEQRARRLN